MTARRCEASRRKPALIPPSCCISLALALEVRVDVAAGQLIGLALLRYALLVEPIASASVEELVHRCAPALAVSLGSAAAESGWSPALAAQLTTVRRWIEHARTPTAR
jgi:hypothetical protein